MSKNDTPKKSKKHQYAIDKRLISYLEGVPGCVVTMPSDSISSNSADDVVWIHLPENLGDDCAARNSLEKLHHMKQEDLPDNKLVTVGNALRKYLIEANALDSMHKKFQRATSTWNTVLISALILVGVCLVLAVTLALLSIPVAGIVLSIVAASLALAIVCTRLAMDEREQRFSENMGLDQIQLKGLSESLAQTVESSVAPKATSSEALAPQDAGTNHTERNVHATIRQHQRYSPSFHQLVAVKPDNSVDPDSFLNNHPIKQCRVQ